MMTFDLNTTEEELLHLYGMYIYETKGAENFAPLDEINGYLEFGKKTFFDTFSKISEKICTNETIKKHIIHNERIDDAHLSILIFEALTHYDWIKPFHATFLVAIIIKKGLYKLCGFYHESNG